MSKGIRWEIPFVSLLGKRYVIEIYDNQGDWSGITTLQAGPSPFSTEETSDSDLFTPIRTQSATLQICTAIPSGGTLRMEDIMPSNNTERPVRLCRLDVDDERDVEWVGFLSCEVYSQDYIGIPDILSISAIGILEAMDSVECDIENLNGIEIVYNILGYVCGEMESKFGKSLGHVYISGEGRAFLGKYINTSIFYYKKERVNGFSREEYIVGVTLKEVLTTIAQYIGWCVREQGNDIYFQTMLNDHSMIRTTIAELNESQPDFSVFVSTELMDIADLTWRGTGHQKSVFAGGRNVEVDTNIEKFNTDLKIPGFPKGEYITAANSVIIPNTEEDPKNATVYISEELKFSNSCDLQVFEIEDYNVYPFFDLVLVNDVDKLYAHSFYDDLGITYNTVAGAAMIRFLNPEENFSKQGVYVRGTDLEAIEDEIVESDYVMKLRSILHLCAYNGKFELSFDGMFCDGTSIPNGYYIYVAVKWGGYFLQKNRRTWGTNFAYISLMKQDDPTVIEITNYNYGEVEIMLLPFTLIGTSNSIQEYIISTLSLTYKAPEGAFDDTSNTYFETLNTSFKNDKSISLDITSSFNNAPSPSLILNADPNSRYDPLTTMKFYAGEEIEMRPELMLLGKMEKYYKVPRTSLKLDVEMPHTRLPLLNLMGINDRKAYLPIGHEKNWRSEVTKLYCSETPAWLVIKNYHMDLWDNEFDYIRLTEEYDEKVMYISSPIDVTWEIRNADANIYVMINGSYRRGTISAGTDKEVLFTLTRPVSTSQNVIIDLYQNDELVYSIEVIIG